MHVYIYSISFYLYIYTVNISSKNKHRFLHCSVFFCWEQSRLSNSKKHRPATWVTKLPHRNKRLPAHHPNNLRVEGAKHVSCEYSFFDRMYEFQSFNKFQSSKICLPDSSWSKSPLVSAHLRFTNISRRIYTMPMPHLCSGAEWPSRWWDHKRSTAMDDHRPPGSTIPTGK